MRSETAIARVERILNLLPLLTKEEMKLTEVARLASVDAETLRHDLEVAFLCGIPGYTPDLLIDVHLDDEIVSVTDAQGLDQPRPLAPEEIALILLGLDFLEVLLNRSRFDSKHAASLRRKLGGEGRAAHAVASDPAEGVWQIVETAIAEGKDLVFDYVDTLGRVTTGRRVTPIQIRLKGDRPILEGFDRTRSDRRFFFLGSVSRCDVSREPSDPVPVIDSGPNAARLAKVTMRSIPRWWIRRHAPFIVAVQENVTSVVVDLEYWSEEWLSHALLPIVDQLMRFEDPSLPEDRLRETLLSHFSGSATPVDG